MNFVNKIDTVKKMVLDITIEGSRAPNAAPENEELYERISQENGFTRREISDEEIVDRCILALINEGANILSEGVAQRAVDIDVVYINGYGFPIWRGGPMHYANAMGLDVVVELSLIHI